MCGIAGILSRVAGGQRQAVESMLDAMSHRGPNGTGVWVSPSGQCVLGHRRLAILDLSPNGSQPMVSPQGNKVLSYNGECYNFPELRRELTLRGETWRSTGDSEVVLKLLVRDGADALAKLNGMFALAAWDETAGRLLLARDRFGQKPLYWARWEDGIVFASEVRALLASGLLPRQLSRHGVLSYLCQGAVQGPDTIVKDVWLLPRASTLTVEAGESPRIGCYWRPPRETRSTSGLKLANGGREPTGNVDFTTDRPVGSRPPFAADVRREFVEAVRRHLVSDVGVGVFLSGGIDSSLVATACREAGHDVTSLTVVFPDDRGECESDFARRAADQAGTRHVEVPVGDPEMLGLVDEAMTCLDQPSIDGVNTFIVSRTARQAGLSVALSGLGGDELFGGYSTFRNAQRCARLRSWGGAFSAPLSGVAGQVGFWNRRWSKLADTLMAPPGLISAYLNRRRLFSSRQVQAIVPQLAQAGWLGGLAEHREAELSELIANRHPLDAIAHLELDVYMGHTLLRDTDVMGMANGLEIRVPFLDTQFSEMALSLPHAVRAPQPYAKWLLIEAFRDCLPRDNWHRPKQGFTLPWQRWMLSSLQPRIAAGLAALADCEGVVHGPSVRELWRQFQQRPNRVGWSRVWALFVLGEYIAQHQLSFRDQDLAEPLRPHRVAAESAEYNVQGCP